MEHCAGRWRKAALTRSGETGAGLSGFPAGTEGRLLTARGLSRCPRGHHGGDARRLHGSPAAVKGRSDHTVRAYLGIRAFDAHLAGSWGDGPWRRSPCAICGLARRARGRWRSTHHDRSAVGNPSHLLPLGTADRSGPPRSSLRLAARRNIASCRLCWPAATPRPCSTSRRWRPTTTSRSPSATRPSSSCSTPRASGGELTGLDIDDVDLASNVVRVIGKGDKERTVPFRCARGQGHRALAHRRAAPARRCAERPGALPGPSGTATGSSSGTHDRAWPAR